MIVREPQPSPASLIMVSKPAYRDTHWGLECRGSGTSRMSVMGALIRRSRTWQVREIRPAIRRFRGHHVGARACLMRSVPTTGTVNCAVLATDHDLLRRGIRLRACEHVRVFKPPGHERPTDTVAVPPVVAALAGGQPIEAIWRNQLGG